MMSKYFNIFCQATLFILLFAQCTLIYLSLNYKGIPISNSLVQKYIPENLNLSSKEILFFLPYHIKLIEPEFTQKADNLLQLNSPEIFLSWRPDLSSLTFNLWKIHSYSGKVSSKLYPGSFELNRLSLLINGFQIQNARMLLRADDKIVHLNYSAEKYLAHYEQTQINKETIKQTELLTSSIDPDSSFVSLIKAFHASKNSHIECFIKKTEGASFALSAALSSQSIEIEGNKFEGLQVQSQYSLDSSNNNIFFQAANYLNPGISLQTDSIRGQLNLGDQMKIHSIEVVAKTVLFNNHVFDAITADLSPRHDDHFIINGILFQKSHCLSFHTDYQINAPKNTVFTKAYLNLNELQNDYFTQIENIYIPSSKSIFAEAVLYLDKNINLLSAQGYLQGEAITINTTPLEFFRSDIEWINHKLKTNSVLKISQRISYAKTDFDANSGDYICSLNGNTFSTDFNSIMPKWWRNTFKDFSYSDNTQCFHDFAIYGTINSPIPDLYLGSVKTTDLHYKNVPVKYGDVFVQGKNHCTEIKLKDVQTLIGKAEGIITITTKPDGFRKPESVRTKLKSELTISTAAKLFGNDVQNILSDFESPYTHKVDFESVFFDPHYTQNINKSYYNLSIERSNPIAFFNRPFDQLSAKIFGRGTQHFIRSASAEFAGGQLNFEADILETLSEDPQLRINLELTDSNYSQCIKDTFQNEFENTTFNQSPSLDLELTVKSEGSLLDLTKHNGYGNLEISGSGLGKINLLGPFSKALDELKLSIGIFSLDHLESNFLIQRESINVQNLELNGKESQVLGQGRIRIPDQSIDFKMEVDLLKNRNISFSKLGNIGKFFNPVTKILNFNVTGTLQDQKWRSIFDPRNLFE